MFLGYFFYSPSVQTIWSLAQVVHVPKSPTSLVIFFFSFHGELSFVL